MHLYIIPRGIRHEVEMFEKYIQGQMFPWIRTNLKTGEKFITMFQLGYRDAGPFKELIFPEECLWDVLQMLNYFETETRSKDYAINNAKMFAMRTILGKGVKAMPKKEEVIYNADYPRICLVRKTDDGKTQIMPYRYAHSERIAIHFIGIKKDKRGTMSTTETGDPYEQEFL